MSSSWPGVCQISTTKEKAARQDKLGYWQVTEMTGHKSKLDNGTHKKLMDGE